MGRAVEQAINAANGARVSSVWQRGASLRSLLAESDVLIDFSLPEANEDVIAAVVECRTPLVCGVSGLDAAQMENLQAASLHVPIVFDRNMSQGISVLAELAYRAAQSLGSEFRVQIHEVHHTKKIDSPSGTALQLGEIIAAARGSSEPVHYEVERRGEVPGDHAVILSSPTETLALQHSVTDRSVFAEGALRAARWVITQPPGLYRMRDILYFAR